MIFYALRGASPSSVAEGRKREDGARPLQPRYCEPVFVQPGGMLRRRHERGTHRSEECAFCLIHWFRPRAGKED